MQDSDQRQMRQHSFLDDGTDSISEATYQHLIQVLEREYGEENVHRTVEVQTGSVVKTIDNQEDAEQTIENIMKKEDEEHE